MLYEELQIKLMKSLKPHWSRVISFDIETRIEDPSRFLKKRENTFDKFSEKSFRKTNGRRRNQNHNVFLRL